MSAGAGPVSGDGRPRVAVVGGGLAGMSAALACIDAGVAVTLFEARKWLGGATSSFEREGLTMDTGQHVFLRCCTAYRAFLARVGAADLAPIQPRLLIPVLAPGGRRATLRRNWLPAPLHLGSSLATYPFLKPSERLRAVRAVIGLLRLNPRDPALDARTFGEWLRERGQSEASVRYLWDLFGLPTLNLPAGEASLALAVKVFRTGLLERGDAADIGVPAVPLSRLHAGPALQALTKGRGEVRLGARVRGVLIDERGVRGVAEDAAVRDADAVILCVPHDRVRGLLPPSAIPAAARFDRLASSPIAGVHVVYDRPVTDLAFAAAVDSPVQWVFDRTGPAGLRRGQYLAISLSGAASVIDDPVERFRQTYLPALAELFPAARGAKVERFLVTRERAATFRQAPGTASMRPGPRTDVAGLFLAGAWTDTGWPATMEGAVRSGLAASRAALLALGRTHRLPAEVAA